MTERRQFLKGMALAPVAATALVSEGRAEVQPKLNVVEEVSPEEPVNSDINLNLSGHGAYTTDDIEALFDHMKAHGLINNVSIA